MKESRDGIIGDVVSSFGHEQYIYSPPFLPFPRVWGLDSNTSSHTSAISLFSSFPLALLKLPQLCGDSSLDGDRLDQ